MFGVCHVSCIDRQLRTIIISEQFWGTRFCGERGAGSMIISMLCSRDRSRQKQNYDRYRQTNSSVAPPLEIYPSS